MVRPVVFHSKKPEPKLNRTVKAGSALDNGRLPRRRQQSHTVISAIMKAGTAITGQPIAARLQHGTACVVQDIFSSDLLLMSHGWRVTQENGSRVLYCPGEGSIYKKVRRFDFEDEARAFHAAQFYVNGHMAVVPATTPDDPSPWAVALEMTAACD
jgi:hypothetical protein